MLVVVAGLQIRSETLINISSISSPTLQVWLMWNLVHIHSHAYITSLLQGPSVYVILDFPQFWVSPSSKKQNLVHMIISFVFCEGNRAAFQYEHWSSAIHCVIFDFSEYSISRQLYAVQLRLEKPICTIIITIKSSWVWVYLLFPVINTRTNPRLTSGVASGTF